MPGPRGNIDGVQRARKALTEADVRAIVQSEIAGLGDSDAIVVLTMTGDVAGQSVGSGISVQIENGVIELNNFAGSVLTYLLSRANHTGTESADVIVDGTTNKAYTASEKTKLGLVASGSYTPTLGNVANAPTRTAYVTAYSRNGSTVHVGGRIDVTPGGAGLCQVSITLPVASNFGAVGDLGGVAAAYQNPQVLGAVSPDVAADFAVLSFYAASAVLVPVFFNFTYRVI